MNESSDQPTLELLKLELCGVLHTIKALCVQYGLLDLNRFTLIARSPTDPTMCFTLSNDDVQAAIKTALVLDETESL